MSILKSVAIIPARYESTRLPGKVLSAIGGKAMLHHVVDRARASNCFERVLVATDHDEVVAYCNTHAIDVILTASTHISGTDRVAEAVATIDTDIVVNLQADEPFLKISHIKALVTAMHKSDLVTLCCPFEEEENILDYNMVKVVTDMHGKALYFSRAAIPAHRDAAYGNWQGMFPYKKHMGVYGFTKDVLQKLVGLPPSPLEIAEKLEQLRWLENGYDIHVVEVSEGTMGIDTPEDLELARKIYRYEASNK